VSLDSETFFLVKDVFELVHKGSQEDMLHESVSQGRTDLLCWCLFEKKMSSTYLLGCIALSKNVQAMQMLLGFEADPVEFFNFEHAAFEGQLPFMNVVLAYSRGRNVKWKIGDELLFETLSIWLDYLDYGFVETVHVIKLLMSEIDQRLFSNGVLISETTNLFDCFSQVQKLAREIVDVKLSNCARRLERCCSINTTGQTVMIMKFYF
jgi:hypothetical protein